MSREWVRRAMVLPLVAVAALSLIAEAPSAAPSTPPPEAPSMDAAETSSPPSVEPSITISPSEPTPTASSGTSGSQAAKSPASSPEPSSTPGFTGCGNDAQTGSPATMPATGLAVDLIGSVKGTYPDFCLDLSIVDAANGRPIKTLASSALAAKPAVDWSADPAPFSPPLSGTQSPAVMPAAYVLLLDISESVFHNGRWELEKGMAERFLDSLAPNDIVMLRTYGSDSDPFPNPSWCDRAVDAGCLLNMERRIETMVKEPKRDPITDVGAPIRAASTAANRVPTGRAGISRRAVVVITDADPFRTGAGTPISVGDIGLTPVFVMGMQHLTTGGAASRETLQNAADFSGGKYEYLDPALDVGSQAADLFAPIWTSTQSTWMVRFHTDRTPDGGSHEVQLTIDSGARKGTVAFSYAAGDLNSLGSSIGVTGLSEGSQVSTNKSVGFSAQNVPSWGTARIELYLDCDPGPNCRPINDSTKPSASVAYPIDVRSMKQGKHKFVALLWVADSSGKSYGPIRREVTFSRAGTSWNIAALALVFGVALVLIGSVFTAARRRGRTRPRRRVA